MGSLLGQTVNPVTPQPIVGKDNQNSYIQALFNNTLTQKSDGSFTLAGVPQYGGQVNANVNNTILPSVTSSWQPEDAGMLYIANQLYGPNGLGKQPDSSLSQLSKQGGTGGPGSAAQENILQYGSGSKPIGDWMHSLAKYGAAGPAGQPLNNIAQGFATGAASYLAPFLNASSKSGAYVPPNLP